GAVEPQPDARPLAADDVLVPVAVLDDLVAELGVGPGQDLVAPRLVVERPPVVLPGVGLVADHLVVPGYPPGAELDAGVGVLPVAEELELHPQLEVAEGLLCAEELVSGHHALERAAGDGALLDPPRLLRVPLPAGEGLAVEEGLRLARAGRGQGQ